MRSPRRLPVIGVVALIAGAVVLSACGSGYSKIRAQWGAKYGVPTWVVNALTPTKDANGVPRVTLQATPGEELSIDLAGTVLKGRVFRNGTRTGYRCIDKVEWVLEGPTSTLKSGAETWLSGSAPQRSECNLGAVDRILRITMPGDLPAGSTLEMKVYSDACGDKRCRSWRTSPSASASAWITGLVNVDLDVVAPTATGLYMSFMPSSGTYRDIGRVGLDGAGLNTALVTAPSDIQGIAVHGEYVYWSTATTIGRAKLDGSEANSNFITGLGAVEDIAVNDSHIYWIDNDGATTYIGRAALDGSGVDQTWFVSASVLKYLAATSTDVYYASASFALGTFGRVPANDPLNPVSLNAGAGGTLGDFATDGTHLYISGTYDSVNHDYVLSRMPLDASTPPAIFISRAAQGFSAYRGVTVGGGYVYWAVQRSSDNAWFISRAKVDGSEVEDMWLSLSVTPNALASAAAASRSAAARQTGSTYTGKAKIRLFKTVVKKNPKMVGFSARGEILAGRYSLRTPAKAGGVKRPTGLASFRGGHYAQKTNELVFTPVSETKTIVTGSGTILLRGKKNALLCATIDSTGTATTYTFVGGKGVGATVQGTMTGAPLDFTGAWAKAAGLKIKNGVVTQNRALNETATMAVTTAKATKLPKSCRSLVRYLPKAKKAT